MQRITAMQPRQCDTITVEQADPEFDPSLVYMRRCGIDGPINIDNYQADSIPGRNDWVNDHAVGTHLHAFIRAQVLLNGEPLPINVDDAHDYRRQVDSTTYETMVSPGTTQLLPFDVPVSATPVGQDMPIEVDVLLLEARTLDQF